MIPVTSPRTAFGITRLARLTCLLASLSAGCGFSTGIRLAPAVGSIGVEMFGNDSAFTDLERDLHVQLSRSVRNISSAPLADPNRADLIIRGRIVSYLRRGGIRSRTNRLLESGLRIEVKSELWTGAGVRVVGPNVSRVDVGYTLDTPGNEREARERALKIIADRIVLDLLSEAKALETAPGQ